MGIFAGRDALQRLEARTDQVVEQQREALEALQRLEAGARERIDALAAELDAERARCRDLAQQMRHLVEELGASRKLWHHCRDKAAAYDQLVAKGIVDGSD